MGLDMYLYRREYLSNYSWGANHEKERNAFHAIADAIGIEPTEQAPHIHVEVCVAYWRKANAIHGYIVQNHAGGVDECQNIYLTRQDLKSLRDKCESVLLAPATAVEYAAEQNGLMPTLGFFFGSYDYDEWYMRDMEDTVSQLDKILESVPEGGWTDFIYRASW
jgi:hypothetical protein